MNSKLVRVQKRIYVRAVLLGLNSMLVISACNSSGNRPVEVLPSNTSQPIATLTSLPTHASVPISPQASITPDASATTYGIGSMLVSEKDDAVLVFVPQGEFLMGSDDEIIPEIHQSPSYYDNQPQHTVLLDAFWIDKFEVTNGQYKRCVSEQVCDLPVILKSPTRSAYYNDSVFDDYPVIYVDWYKAKAYCEWAGRRLPTEAEWEKAARGTDGRIYPWKDTLPNDVLVNYNSLNRDTTPVGMYPGGQSPYGAEDMAGNVWEWVNDWYVDTYYQNSPRSNPMGPDAGEPNSGHARVLRGGSWYYREGSPRSIFRFGVLPAEVLIRSDLRGWLVPDYDDTGIYGKPPLGLGTVGFRCAMSAIP
ncbi:MAG: formylglycine-generating enzyme family protein [Anaerolineales bacterium]|nr:formylglycine-generating enzyme family protein [Anaerolineales bacterium]